MDVGLGHDHASGFIDAIGASDGAIATESAPATGFRAIGGVWSGRGTHHHRAKRPRCGPKWCRRGTKRPRRGSGAVRRGAKSTPRSHEIRNFMDAHPDLIHEIGNFVDAHPDLIHEIGNFMDAITDSSHEIRNVVAARAPGGSIGPRNCCARSRSRSATRVAAADGCAYTATP